jgi:FlaA1/EpsC-like NDP-sugar epimerase
MVYTNILGSTKVAKLSKWYGVKKYFCVSTDKATNPVNMMGASKRIMELFLHKESHKFTISMARFANVAFSNGSLLDGFEQRVKKYQPISAPNDIRRYFITQKEAGELCMLSCLFGENREVFFPKHGDELKLTLFTQIARNYIKSKGFEVLECASEQEAREACKNIDKLKRWPCYFFESDTTGEKDFEEFYSIDEEVDFDRFKSIGIIKNEFNVDTEILNNFEDNVRQMYVEKKWSRADLVYQFKSVLNNFEHKETGKFLNLRM